MVTGSTGMAPAAEWRDVAVRYPYAEADAVGPVTLDVRRGEVLLLLGSSGAGKSTLLATLTGLVPQTMPADVSGEVRVFGEAAASRRPAQWSTTVARLFQNAEETLCGMTIGDEVAFALENRALPVAEIEARMAAAMQAVGLEPQERGRRTMALSGGEKQIVALAALLAQDAALVVVDEPTAHLAPAAAARLSELVLARKEGRSVIVVDHRLDGLVGSVDRVAVIDGDGRLMAEGDPRTVFVTHREALAAQGIWRPVATELSAELAAAGMMLEPTPLDIGEAIRGLEGLAPDRRAAARPQVARFVSERLAQPAQDHGAVAARLEGAACAPFLGPVVLENIDLVLHTGEAVAILGANGAGKSTLGASLAGLLRLKAGRRDGGPGGMAFQNPEGQFVAGSVGEEIAAALGIGARGYDLPPPPPPCKAWWRGRTTTHRDDPGHGAEADAARIAAVLRAWRLDGLAARHPFELSQGQKRRLALACLVEPARFPLLVLDEPTAGLDAAGVEGLSRVAQSLRGRGTALAIITHELDFALATCPRAVIVGEGRILADGPCPALLADRDLMRRAGLETPALLDLAAWVEAIAAVAAC
ncbi:ATP-binding cassette domain-containing protein [Aquibium sp. ELW1220]|uniref:ABC transporter ATP-binding protein n=1 Tax=Aquibium sp. ELW1220 TaxID=2976766 RepID=UPI0025B0C56E|nr:ATP-binding cassette domain-containing protein [Aquibium sp. ELW1220]MDN2583226.1 ATP-binding cassette domain-containing protein [Aquibium sp. ELW1220]